MNFMDAVVDGFAQTQYEIEEKERRMNSTQDLINRLNQAAEQMAKGVHSPGHIAAIKDAVKKLEETGEASGLDWSEAVKNVEFYREEYSKIGGAGIFGMNTIDRLLCRYRSGERTRDLYDSMVSVE